MLDALRASSASLTGGAAAGGGIEILSKDRDQAASTYDVGVQADALPVWTIDQIAEYLISKEGTGNTRRWDVAEGGTLTVNLAGLTAGGQYLAREALALWSDLTGIKFVEVTTVADT